MLIVLYFCAIVLLSIELFFIGLVTGFFQNKFIIKDTFAFLLVSVIATLLLAAGNLLGNFLAKLISDYNIWYAATVLFILGFKMIYSGIKLYKVKQQINPLNLKGLLILAILTGLNTFFVGLGFGLMQLANKYIYLSSMVFMAVILLGYFTGFKSKKLLSYKNEFISGICFIIIAIIIIANY